MASQDSKCSMNHETTTPVRIATGWYGLIPLRYGKLRIATDIVLTLLRNATTCIPIDTDCYDTWRNRYRLLQRPTWDYHESSTDSHDSRTDSYNFSTDLLDWLNYVSYVYLNHIYLLWINGQGLFGQKIAFLALLVKDQSSLCDTMLSGVRPSVCL